MAKKKKKNGMTAAQAAAARREDVKRKTGPSPVRDDGPVDRGNRLVMGVTIAMIILIVVLSAVFSIGPMNVLG